MERKVAELFDRGVTFKNYTAEQVEQQIEMAKYRYVTTGDIEQAAAMVTRANGLRDYVRNLFPESLTISVRVEKNNY